VGLPRYERAVGVAIPRIPPNTAKSQSLARKYLNRSMLHDPPQVLTGVSPGCPRENTVAASRM